MTKSKRTRGRSGGRAGGAGYDYQDVYVAWQLARMLMSDRDPIVEVLWEKKAIDFDHGNGAESTYVDDAIVLLRSGKWIYTQLKEGGPASGWTARHLIRSGVLSQLWEQWQTCAPERRSKTFLQLASSGNLGSLALVSDAAMRSRTPTELMSEETASETPKRRSLTEALYEDKSERSEPAAPKSAIELANALTECRRFVLVGSQGCGKTTIARWLVLLCQP